MSGRASATAGRAPCGVFCRAVASPEAPLHQTGRQLLQPGTAQRQLEMFRPTGVGCDEGQVDLSLHHGGQLDLGLFSRLFQPLQSHAILAQINALLLPELVGHPVDDDLVEVIAAQEGVAVGGFDLEHAVAHVQDGDVEGAAAQIIDCDPLINLFIQPVSQGGGCRLIDDPKHLEAGNATGILGGLALAVVEISRDGDHGLGDGLAQVLLGIVLDLLQHHSRDFLG